MPEQIDPNLIHRFTVSKSEAFPVIMQKYDLYGRHMSNRKFYAEYVKPMDPSLTLSAWNRFVSKLHKSQKELVVRALNKSNQVALTDAAMEQNSIRNALKIGNITLEMIANSPEMLMTMPVKERIALLFHAMKATDSRTKVSLQARQDQRQETMFEALISGVQYGGLGSEDIRIPKEEIKSNVPKESIPRQLQPDPSESS